MANIDITGLFSDVLGSTQQQQTERELQRRDAEAQANLVGQLGGMAAYLAPQRSAALSSAAGGLLGLDTRTEADKLKEQLQSLGTPSTPEEHQRYADLLDKLRPGSGVQYMMSVAQEQRAEQQTAADTTRAEAAATEAATRQELIPVEQQRAMTARIGVMNDVANTAQAVLNAKDLQDFRQDQILVDNRNASINEESNRIRESEIQAATDELGSRDRAAVRAATESAREETAKAINANGIAQQYLELQMRAGAPARAEEAWNAFWGQEDQVTEVRNNFEAIRNTFIMSALPKGAASDKDIEIAMRPFPPSTANAEYIASYLRGMAKLSAFKAKQEELRAIHLAENKGIDSKFAEEWREKMADEEFRNSIAEQYGFEWMTEAKQQEAEESNRAAQDAADIDAEIARQEAAAAVSADVPQSVTRGALF
jgi:hypothetical protein